MSPEFLNGQPVLVTGGTGSFGQALVSWLLGAGAQHVRILSRDEAKQDAMRHHFQSARLDFITGDVRDYETVEASMEGMAYVFHAAALKQVPNCERFPVEAVRTNVLGAEHVRRAALRCAPCAVIAISTDKAVKPLNAMGCTKALMERILLQPRPPENANMPRFVCVRYGNVLGSRGSVVPLYLDKARRGEPLPITDPNMTRFLLTLPGAVELVLRAARCGRHGQVWVRKMPAATVAVLAEACAPGHPTQIVGVRPGEKMHEVLVSEDEMRRTVDEGDHYIIYPNADEPHDYCSSQEEYTSTNTSRLDVAGVRAMLQGAGVLA